MQSKWDSEPVTHDWLDEDGLRVLQRELEQLAARGDAEAMIRIGQLHVGIYDDEEERWYRQAAELGNPRGMYLLAVTVGDLGASEEAELWFRRAADLGHSHAMVELGRIAEEEAQDWYQRSADLGDSHGMVNLGRVFERHGNLDEAERWYRRALDANDGSAPHARDGLGRLFELRGEIDAAENWYNKRKSLEELLQRKRAPGDDDSTS